MFEVRPRLLLLDNLDHLRGKLLLWNIMLDEVKGISGPLPAP
jgi:hypothetical protein